MARRLSFCIVRPQPDKSPLHIDTVPREANNLAEPLSKLIGGQQNRPQMRLGSTVESSPLLICQHPISFVIWIGKSNFRGRIILKQPSTNRKIKAVLECYVIMINGLNTGRFSIAFISLSPEGFNILGLYFSKEWIGCAVPL